MGREAYAHLGGHCIRCRAAFAPVQVVVVVREYMVFGWLDPEKCGLDCIGTELEWVTVCAACAEPAEQAVAKYEVTCEGCGQPMLTPHYVKYRPVREWRGQPGTRGGFSNIPYHVCSKRCEQRYRRKLKREARKMQSCTVCGLSFRPKRSDAKFCSNACRQKAHRAVVADVTRRIEG
jgi:hypothetical protein